MGLSYSGDQKSWNDHTEGSSGTLCIIDWVGGKPRKIIMKGKISYRLAKKLKWGSFGLGRGEYLVVLPFVVRREDGGLLG